MDRMTKSDLQDAIQTGRLEFDHILDEIPDEELTEPVLDNGWSVRDVVMHLITWEQRLMGWLNTAAQGDDPQIPAPGYDWDDVDDLNERTHEQQQDRSLDDVMASYRASLNLIFIALEKIGNPTLNSNYFETENEPLWKTIAKNTYLHYAEHAEAIKKARNM